MDLDPLDQRIKSFAAARDWDQFHSLKNLALALTSEVGELAELLMWKTDSEIQSALDGLDFKEELSMELADLLIYLLRLFQQSGIDPIKSAHRKLDINEARYPVELSKGNAKKYTQLEDKQ